jgi:hypothetical protein
VTTLADAIEALRRAVTAAGSGNRADVADAVEDPAFKDPDIVEGPGECAIDHISVALAEPTTIDALEGLLGPARRLPRSPSGDRRTVIFGQTVPEDGESGATILAEVDEEGHVSRLIVRADAF